MFSTGADLVMQKVDLPAALQLTLAGFLDQRVVPLG